MICPRCGSTLPDKSSICPNCGNKLTPKSYFHQPSDLSSTSSSGPDYNRPPEPDYNRPPEPDYRRPPEPDYNRPPEPDYRRLPEPDYNRPPEPDYRRPPEPDYNRPPEPDYRRPPEPDYNRPPVSPYKRPENNNENTWKKIAIIGGAAASVLVLLLVVFTITRLFNSQSPRSLRKNIVGEWTAGTMTYKSIETGEVLYEEKAYSDYYLSFYKDGQWKTSYDYETNPYYITDEGYLLTFYADVQPGDPEYQDQEEEARKYNYKLKITKDTMTQTYEIKDKDDYTNLYDQNGDPIGEPVKMVVIYNRR